MQITNELSRWQLVPLVFMQDGVAASQTNVQLPIAEVNAGAGNAVDGYVMPFEGEIVAISAALSAAATAGSLTVGPTIAGTEKTDPTLSITTDTAKSDTCGRGTNRFAKDAVIGAEITSDGSWDGTGSDLLVTVWVLLKIMGI
jgi:hypothetical protein